MHSETDTDALRALLKEVETVMEVLEDEEMNAVPQEDPLREKAHGLGVVVGEKTTFGELHDAIERRIAEGVRR
ncbi:MAG: hypothetical protein JWQ00_254 [Noviherbaspirillum sp.]|jgi:hypothetical protein|nr:hypothetical protein [Noviherbaspirillum sp.]